MNEKTQKEMNFFQKMLASIKDFEKYPILASQHFTKVASYLIILNLFMTVICGLVFSIQMYQKMGQVISYIDKELPNLYYENNELTVESGEQPIKIAIDDELIQKIIIDTSKDLSQENIEEEKDELKQNQVGILLLNDKMYFKLTQSNELIEYTYEDFFAIYGIEKFQKSDIVNYFSGNNMIILTIAFFITYFIYFFMFNMIMVMMYALFLGIAGYLTAVALRLRLKISAMIKMAVYALTLPTILLTIYTVINQVTGFTITYFDIMYITVAYIYMIAALFIIKSDIIKKQQELTMIIEEQAKIAAQKQAEEEQKEKERQEKEEAERRKKREEEKKKREKKQDEQKGTDSPQADNV